MTKKRLLREFRGQTEGSQKAMAMVGKIGWTGNEILLGRVNWTMQHMVEAMDYYRVSFARLMGTPTEVPPKITLTDGLTEYKQACARMLQFLEQIPEQDYCRMIEHENVAGEGEFEDIFWRWIYGHDKFHLGSLMALLRIAGGPRLQLPFVHGVLREKAA